MLTCKYYRIHDKSDLTGCPQCERDYYIKKYKKAKRLYTKLTRCKHCQAGPYLVAVYCPSELLREFEDLFDDGD